MRIDAYFGLGKSQTVIFSLIICVFLIVVMHSQRPEIDKKVSAGISDIPSFYRQPQPFTILVVNLGPDI